MAFDFNPNKPDEVTNTTVTNVNFTLPEGTPVNAVNAVGTQTYTGVVVNGETVTVGTDVYEYAADVAQTVSVGNIAVNITANVTASQGTLTLDTQPTAGNTMTIGTKVYTFVPNGTANSDGEVSIGTDLPSAKVNVVAAINGSDGVNTAHTLVTAAAFVADDSVITALVGGVAGNLIATTETFTAGTNVFDAVVLGTTTAGADCIAANAIIALVAAVTASDTVGVGAVDGNGDTVVFTADVAGILGNSIATTTTCANATFATATLIGGVNGTVVAAGGLHFRDSGFLYYTNAANTIAGKNWRRVTGNSF